MPLEKHLRREGHWALELLIVVTNLTADQFSGNAQFVKLSPTPERMIFAVTTPTPLEIPRTRPAFLLAHALRVGIVRTAEEPVAYFLQGDDRNRALPGTIGAEVIRRG